jgi:hypothetical protein
MKLAVQLLEPSEEVRISFVNYVKYDVNNVRDKQGLPPLSIDQSLDYLAVCWEFANRFGVLGAART